MVNENTLKSWHKLSFNNEIQIKLNLDSIVSCFYCCKTFSANKITEFTSPRGEDKGTACCPNCSIDSIIPMELSKEDLDQMFDYYF